MQQGTPSSLSLDRLACESVPTCSALMLVLLTCVRKARRRDRTHAPVQAGPCVLSMTMRVHGREWKVDIDP